MAAKISKVDIAQIAHALRTRKNNNQSMVLFLGSRAGGLFHSPGFYEMLKGYSTRNFNLLSHEEQFAECYKILKTDRFSESEINTILTGSLQDKLLIDPHICLAELVKQDLFDIIITTNVDTLLEDAFKDAEMRELHHFDVLMPGRDALQDIGYPNKKFLTRVVKIFGDLPSRVYNITKRSFYLDSIEGLKGLLENVLARDVLVIGFDPVWDAEMLRVFTMQKSPLWLATEEEVTAKHPLAFLTKHGRQIKCVTGKVGSYEQFLKALYWHLFEKMPVNYQLTHDTLSELRLMRNNLSQLGMIYREVQAVHKDILLLQEKFEQCSNRESAT